LLYTVPKCGFV